MDKIIRTKKELKEWLDYETSRYKTKNLLDRILNISEASLLRHHQILLRKTEYYYNTNKKLNYLVCKVKLGRFQKKIWNKHSYKYVRKRFANNAFRLCFN